MGAKRTNKQYSTEFKEEAVALRLEQGYSVSEAAKFAGYWNKPAVQMERKS
jgi:transposase-like protein